MKSSVILRFYSYRFGEISCVSSALHRMSGCTKFTKFFTRFIFRLIKKCKIKKKCSITVKNGSFSKIPITKVVLIIYYHRKIRKIAMIFSEVYSVYGRSMKPFFLIKILFSLESLLQNR